MYRGGGYIYKNSQKKERNETQRNVLDELTITYFEIKEFLF